MQAQNSNVNFGMAFRSPSRFAMPYFKKYMSNGTNRIDVEAFGEFIVNQAKNKNVDLQYIHSKNGDMFKIFSINNPNKNVTIPIETLKTNKSHKKWFFEGVKEWFKLKTTRYEYLPLGSMENLPPELKKAGEIANNMEKELT